MSWRDRLSNAFVLAGTALLVVGAGLSFGVGAALIVLAVGCFLLAWCLA